jgi:hypothetical protein
MQTDRSYRVLYRNGDNKCSGIDRQAVDGNVCGDCLSHEGGVACYRVTEGSGCEGWTAYGI